MSILIKETIYAQLFNSGLNHSQSIINGNIIIPIELIDQLRKFAKKHRRWGLNYDCVYVHKSKDSNAFFHENMRENTVCIHNYSSASPSR